MCTPRVYTCEIDAMAQKFRVREETVNQMDPALEQETVVFDFNSSTDLAIARRDGCKLCPLQRDCDPRTQGKFGKAKRLFANSRNQLKPSVAFPNAVKNQ